MSEAEDNPNPPDTVHYQMWELHRASRKFGHDIMKAIAPPFEWILDRLTRATERRS